MADRAHSTSRRALLAGLGMTPLVSVPVAAEPAPVLVTEWEPIPIPPWDGERARSGLGNVIAAPTPHPDAALFALDPELSRLHAENETAYSRFADCEEHAFDLARERGSPERPDWPDIVDKAKRDVGLAAAAAANKRIHLAFTHMVDRLIATPATTFEGLLFKARYADAWDDLREAIVEDLIAIDAKMRAAA